MKDLVDQEFQDTRYDELVRECRKFNRFGRDQSIYAISMIAAVYLRHRHHWPEFQLAQGITLTPRRGPTARSIFQPICRHLLGFDDGGDAMGLASVWAAVLDEWAETDIAVAEIPTWIAGRRGIRAIYDGEDGPKTRRNRNDIEGGDQKPRSLAVARDAAYEEFEVEDEVEETKAAKFYDLIDKKTTTFEWYTPKYIFVALGCRFDLDPASPGRNIVSWISVEDIYTSEGLEREWRGFVWLNAPHGRKVLPDWINKFIEHGNGIALVPDRTSTRWWQELAAQADLPDATGNCENNWH